MRKFLFMSFFLFGILFIQVGCAPKVQITKFSEFPSSPKTGDIDVYTSKDAIKKPYKEIALITVDDEGWDRSESELLQKLISKAKEIGADGIIILSQDKQSEGGVLVGNVFIESNRRIVRGSAIVYELDE